MTPEVEGLQLGHYRLTRRIGAGGMGEVYLAQDLALKREVAIKFVIADGGSDPALARRLLHEAQAVAALDHPCICPVHDVGVDPTGRPYMVMQYVPGETLAARLARGPLPPRDALGLGAQIADALAAAHRHGIIHRDLKPQNVMLSSSGTPKLLDFGIAKVLPSLDTAAAVSETASSLTSRHALVGTPAYMSPEQVHQHPLDGRSDLFSLGAILFETLTGHRAFAGAQLAEVLGAVLHVHPPAPSSLREGLDERHDELVRRLLAKAPSDRFQSADEVVGALRLLLPDTSRTPILTPPGRSPGRVVAWIGHHKVALGIGAALVLAAAFAVPRYLRPALPAPPANAQVWYDRGTEALREGSFHTAAAAFEESARIYGTHPFTYARLAEARAELDDETGAQKALVAAGGLIGNQSRLPAEERLRLEAIRALVLRKVDDAVDLYGKLTERHPSDPTAWLDLGRAQETAGDMDHASASYQRSVSLGPQYPAALVRLGSLQSSQGHRDDGLKTLGEAERLYRIANDGEGEAEVLLRRAEVLDARGEYADARAALDRALALARTADSPSLVVRTNLRRSSVLLSEGKLAEAEQLAAATVQSALDGGLQAIAALGLIDLAGAMQQRGKMAEAEAQVRRAIDLASRQQALRTAARARIALASILSSQGRNEEVLSLLEPSIEYLQRNQYRSLELTASNIFARALQQSGKPDAARAVLEDVLANARRINDRRQEGLALTGLYSIAIASGALPAALDLRQQAETIHRAQSDMTQLPFDLTTRAELLINLGRFEEAGAALRELDEGVSKKLEPFVERQRRASYLRALAATLNRDSDAALRLLSSVTAGTDATGLMVKALREYAEVQARRSRPPAGEIGSLAVEPSASPAVQRELHYWRARAQLAAGTAEGAMASVKAGLALMAGAANDEVEWRLAAAGAAAARRLARADEQRELHDRALAIITRLRDKWRDGARLYEARPDLVELKTAAGL